MKRILTACSLLCLLLVTGCVGMPGTNTGALVGGVAGAALSRDNPIAGAIIGGVGGALIGNMIDNNGGSRVSRQSWLLQQPRLQRPRLLRAHGAPARLRRADAVASSAAAASVGAAALLRWRGCYRC